MSSPAALAVEKMGGMSPWVWEVKLGCNLSAHTSTDTTADLGGVAGIRKRSAGGQGVVGAQGVLTVRSVGHSSVYMDGVQ